MATSSGINQARRLLAQIEEAHGRAVRQLHRAQTEGVDHFAANLQAAHGSLDEGSLDRWNAHAQALASVQG